MGIHFLTRKMRSVISLKSGYLFFSACVAYISPCIHPLSERTAVVWALPVAYSGIGSIEFMNAIFGVPSGGRWSVYLTSELSRGSVAMSALVSLCWISCWWWLCQRGSCLLQKDLSGVIQQQVGEITFILLRWFAVVARKHFVRILETGELWLLLS